MGGRWWKLKPSFLPLPSSLLFFFPIISSLHAPGMSYGRRFHPSGHPRLWLKHLGGKADKDAFITNLNAKCQTKGSGASEGKRRERNLCNTWGHNLSVVGIEVGWRGGSREFAWVSGDVLCCRGAWAKQEGGHLHPLLTLTVKSQLDFLELQTERSYIIYVYIYTCICMQFILLYSNTFTFFAYSKRSGIKIWPVINASLCRWSHIYRN